METTILKINDESLRLAKDLILSGELVAFPTETVYGLGALATDGEAVKKIFEVKGRPQDNPLICHVHENYDINKLVVIRQEYALKLKKAYTPGPLTMVFESKNVVCKEAVAGGDTLALRIPSNIGAKKFLTFINEPIVAPSANLSKHVSPVTAEHVYKDLKGKIRLILDGGKSEGGIESTVLDVTESVPRILRAGLVTKEMIEKVAGACVFAEHKAGDKVKSPGVKYGHYLPTCEIKGFSENNYKSAFFFYDEITKKGVKAVILAEDKICKLSGDRNKINLGVNGLETASNLFYDLRLAEEKFDYIVAVLPENKGGVYDGILNRFEKAVNKNFGEKS